MAPTDTDCLLSSLPTEAPVLRSKPALRSAGPVAEVELAEEELDHAGSEEDTSNYLGLAAEYMAGFKAAQLGLTAADTVLDTLDLVTRCEDNCREVGDAEIAASSPTFGEIEFEEEDTEDVDYCPNEEGERSEDDLEYDSTAEVSCDEEEEACVKAKANCYVKVLQRQCRASRRAGARAAGVAKPVRTIGEVSLLGAVCEVFHVNFFLNLVGLTLAPVYKKIDRKVVAEDTCLVQQKFGDMKLEDYDSEEDADYCPSEASDDSEDQLEYDSEAEESADEVEDCEEAEDKEAEDMLADSKN